MKSETVATNPLRSGQLINKTALVFMVFTLSRTVGERRGEPRLDPRLLSQATLGNLLSNRRGDAACRSQDSPRRPFRSFRISRAAFDPEPPVRPAPGCVPLPQRYRFVTGMRYRAQSSNGRMVKN